MAKSNPTQTSFLGGELSPIVQGRTDIPQYPMGLNYSRNGQPVEEGTWIRRSGTEFIAPTYGRGYAKLLAYIDAATCAFPLEFTYVTGDNGALRLFTQDFMVCDNGVAYVTSGSSDNPYEVVLDNIPSGWEAGDQVYFVLPPGYSGDLTLSNRLMTIHAISNETITLYDDLNATGINGSSFASTDYLNCQVLKVVRFSTPYTSTAVLQALRIVQFEDVAIILDGTGANAPQTLQLTTLGTLTTDPVFSFSPTTFVDGPYLDPQSDTATLSGTSGSITLTPNGPSYTFVSTDVGRHVRVFTQPAAWDSGTTYTYGEQVTDAYGAYWVSVADGAYANDNVGLVPGTNYIDSDGVAVVLWMPAINAASWSWGPITAIGSEGASATVSLQAALQSANGTTATTWQLGLFTATGPVYPTSGGNYEGRMYLGGAVFNRFDASTANQINPFTGNPVADGEFCFSPTDQYGNVNDDNAISETLNFAHVAQIQWFMADHGTLVCGTLDGPFILRASALSDPITPNDIQADPATADGSYAFPAIRAGLSIIFPQKYQRRLLEYIADAFTGKYAARHLNEFSKHLTEDGIYEVAYQEEPSPTIWMITGNGNLVGCTYRRLSRFITSPPDVDAWFMHDLGSPWYPRAAQSMCVLPGDGILTDRLYISTNDSTGANGFIEVMQPVETDTTTFGQSWLLDSSPGRGPGNSGYDCGGGNQSTYNFSFGIYGSADDTSTVGAPVLTLSAQQISSLPGNSGTLPSVVSSSSTAGGIAPQEKKKTSSGPAAAFIGPTSGLMVYDVYSDEPYTLELYGSAIIPINSYVQVPGTGDLEPIGSGGIPNVSWSNEGISITDASQPYAIGMDVRAQAWTGAGGNNKATWSFALTNGSVTSTSGQLQSQYYNNIQGGSKINNGAEAWVWLFGGGGSGTVSIVATITASGDVYILDPNNAGDSAFVVYGAIQATILQGMSNIVSNSIYFPG